jgi:hypothetical protein
MAATTRVVKKGYLIVMFECRGATDKDGAACTLQKEAIMELPQSRMPAAGQAGEYEPEIGVLAEKLLGETNAEALILLGTRVAWGFERGLSLLR